MKDDKTGSSLKETDTITVWEMNMLSHVKHAVTGYTIFNNQN